MGDFKYVKAQPVSIKKHPNLNEAWVRDRIVEDPTILGLGDVEVKDVERILPKAGRLDLLLLDPETDKRYEVELMLGATDESHIIRCLEYWDIERRRYPQCDHCAVLIAEDITSRFLNVVGLFNGFIPLVGIKMSALQVGEQLVLQFVKVLDEMEFGDIDDGGYEPSADRAFWEGKGSKKSLAIADECLAILREVVPSVELTYKVQYLGLAIGGIARNFVFMRPKREFLRVTAKIADPETWAEKLESAGLVVLEGGRSRGRLTFRLNQGEAIKHHDLLRGVFAEAYGVTTE